MADQWYYSRNKQRLGPVSLEQLRQLVASGELQPTDMIFRQGTQKWIPVGSIPELRPADGPAGPAASGSTSAKSGPPPNSACAYDVFISYRRAGGSELAQLVHRTLKEWGYRVFIDVQELRSGRFDSALLRTIEGASDFVLLLTPGSLDRCLSEDDWVRQEIAHAFQTGRNIVLLQTRDFMFPRADSLPPELAKLPLHNAVEHVHEHSTAALEKLRRMLQARPRRQWGRKQVFAASLAAAAFLLVFVCWLGFRALFWDTKALREETAGLQEQGVGIRQDTSDIKKDTTDIKKDTTEIKKGIESIGKLGGLIANPQAAWEYYNNALEYQKRGDFANALQALDRYFEGETKEYYDPYLTYWSLLQRQYNDQKVDRLLKLLCEQKPTSRAARLVAIEHQGSRNLAKQLQQVVQQHSDFLPAYLRLHEAMPRDTILEEMDRSQVEVAFQRQGGFDRLKGFYVDHKHKDLETYGRFGADAPLDPSQFFVVMYQYESHFRGMLLEFADKRPGREVVLTFPDAAVVRVPLEPDEEDEGKKPAATPGRPRGGITSFEEELTPAAAVVELSGGGGPIRYERRRENDVRIFPHNGYLRGVGPGTLTLGVEYVDAKGRSYKFPKPVHTVVPAFATEVIRGARAMQLTTVRKPQLQIHPFEFLSRCEIAARKEGPYLPVPRHINSPTIFEIELGKVPGYNEKAATQVFWIQGVTHDKARVLGPEPVEVHTRGKD